MFHSDKECNKKFLIQFLYFLLKIYEFSIKVSKGEWRNSISANFTIFRKYNENDKKPVIHFNLNFYLW